MFENLYLKNNYATIYDTCVTIQLLDVVSYQNYVPRSIMVP